MPTPHSKTTCLSKAWQLLLQSTLSKPKCAMEGNAMIDEGR